MPSLRDLPTSRPALWLSLIATFLGLVAFFRGPLVDAYDARWPLLVAIAALLICLVAALAWGQRRVRVVNGHENIQSELTRMVKDANDQLICVGSRSRDSDYLQDILERVRSQTKLRHYRVFCGEPRREILKEHGVKLMKMREADPESAGRIHLGICPAADELEPALCVTDDRALVVVPALGRYGRFDSAIVLRGKSDVQTVREYAETMFSSSRELKTVAEVEELRVPA